MKNKLDLHYVDARLVEIYDLVNPHATDTDFYIQLASELKAKVIVDFGCGTGLLTRQLAVEDRKVFGVEPASAMLAVAQRNDVENRVTWLNGDKGSLTAWGADLIMMTRNVAQVFLDDDEWRENLKAIWRALRPGGYVAFESRNPLARQWEDWTPEKTRKVLETPFGAVEEWLQVVNVNPRTVSFHTYHTFKNTGESALVESTLRFRTVEEIKDSLEESGFFTLSIFGGWKREPFENTHRTMLFVAMRR